MKWSRNSQFHRKISILMQILEKLGELSLFSHAYDFFPVYPYLRAGNSNRLNSQE